MNATHTLLARAQLMLKMAASEIISEIADATRQAVEARTKAEAREAAATSAPPPLARPN